MNNINLTAMIYKDFIYSILAQKKCSLTTLRIVIIISLMSSISYRCFAQSNEGIIHFRIISNEGKMLQSRDYIDKSTIEKDLYINANAVSIFYTNLYFNGQETKYENSRENSIGLSRDQSSFSMALNISKRTLSNVIPMAGKLYVISDSLCFPEWIIMNDIKEIAGHICMSASMVDTVRNQKTIAWFASDIPISSGPERWYGLPGMVLEVDINDGAMIITADKIDFLKLTTELSKPKKIKGIKVTQKEYEGIFRNYYNKCREHKTPYFRKARY